MPTRTAGLVALSKYLGRIEDAIDAGQHHDQCRAILIDLLREGFGLTVDEIVLEQNAKVAKVRGRIDLLYVAMPLARRPECE